MRDAPCDRGLAVSFLCRSAKRDGSNRLTSKSIRLRPSRQSVAHVDCTLDPFRTLRATKVYNLAMFKTRALSVVFFGASMLVLAGLFMFAQPKENISKQRHPNLAADVANRNKK